MSQSKYIEMSDAGEYPADEHRIQQAIDSLILSERGAAWRRLNRGDVISDAHGFHYRLRYLPADSTRNI